MYTKTEETMDSMEESCTQQPHLGCCARARVYTFLTSRITFNFLDFPYPLYIKIIFILKCVNFKFN